MKNFAFPAILFILLNGFVSLTSQAQETEVPAMYVVFEEFVSPSDIVTFREVQNKAFEQMDKHNADFTFWAYYLENSSYYWVMPIANFAAIDDFFKKSMELGKKMKDSGYDPDKEFRNLSSMQTSVIRWAKELSYHPGSETGQSTEKPYCEWTFFYMKSGHDKEATEAIQKYIDFYENIDESYEWDVYQVILGADTPCWVFMTRAENEIALRTLEKDLSSKYKEDFKKLWQNFIQHVRKYENKRGWFLPKWSKNLPE